jgi:hypothetical protein
LLRAVDAADFGPEVAQREALVAASALPDTLLAAAFGALPDSALFPILVRMVD